VRSMAPAGTLCLTHILLGCGISVMNPSPLMGIITGRTRQGRAPELLHARHRC